MHFFDRKKEQAFTIVELLVVIVVIGILAAITIVSYSGIANRANTAAIQAELSGSARKLSMYYAQNGFYPSTLDNNGCPLTPVPDENNCVKFSGNSNFTYTYKTASTYELSVIRGSLSYIITENSSPAVYVDPNWQIIGTQVWAKANLNVGNMIVGGTQTDNAGGNVVEKHCYGNSAVNCSNYGGLYSWSEAMNYSITEGAQGICPAGSHIPSDNDWKILEVSLGMTWEQADLGGNRGTDQGTQLKAGGSSGLNLPLGSMRDSLTGGFSSLGQSAFFWTSTKDDASSVRTRAFQLGSADIVRSSWSISVVGFSVRCLKN